MNDMKIVNGIRLETVKCNPVARTKFECYAYAARRVLEESHLKRKKYNRYSHYEDTQEEGAFITAIGRKIQELFPREISFLQAHDDAHAVLLLGAPRGEITSMMFNSGLLTFLYPEMYNASGSGKYYPIYFDQTLIHNRAYDGNYEYYALEHFDQTRSRIPKFHDDKDAKRQLLHTIKSGDGTTFKLQVNEKSDVYRELVLPPDSTLFFRGNVAGKGEDLPMQHAGGEVSYEKDTSPVYRAGETNRSPFEDDQPDSTLKIAEYEERGMHPPESKVGDRRAYAIFIRGINSLKKCDPALVTKWQQRIDKKYAELETEGKFKGLVPTAAMAR